MLRSKLNKVVTMNSLGKDSLPEVFMGVLALSESENTSGLEIFAVLNFSQYAGTFSRLSKYLDLV